MKYSGGALLSSIRLDPQSGKNLNAQLYMAVRDVILSGGVKAGERLPASRTLADELGISRTTVVNALDRLMAEGLLEARQGAGTYVSDVMNAERPAPQPVPQMDSITAEPRLSHTARYFTRHFTPRNQLPKQAKPFVTGLPSIDSFPMAQWSKLAAKHWRSDRDMVMGYGDPKGDPALRRAIASHVNASRGIQCDPDQIFVTGGAQQAFQMIGAMLLNPGDRVWFENPGAIGAKNSLVACGADLVPVSVDDEGISVEDGLEKAPHFRMAFVTPSHQQPLSMVMSLRRRFALLKAVQEADAWVVEDDYDSEFYFGGQPLPTLKSVDTTGRVIYVGTFSKSLFPSLRVGFVLSPASLVETFEMICTSSQAGIATSLQRTIADFMDEGHFATHIRRMRQVYAERHDALIKAAEANFGGLMTVRPTLSGLHTVGYLGDGLMEKEADRRLVDGGLATSPLSRYCLAPIEKQGFALGFGAVRPEEIRTAVTRMAGLLKTLRNK